MVIALFYAYNLSMGYIRYNSNPCGKNTADCTVRALSTLFGEEWDSIYLQLCLLGLSMCEMPSQKAVIHEFMRQNGYERHIIPLLLRRMVSYHLKHLQDMGFIECSNSLRNKKWNIRNSDN